MAVRSRSTGACVLTACLLMVAASFSSAQIVYPLGMSSTATFTQGGGLGETPRGWDFLVNAANLEVVQLGVNAATAGTVTLSLWDNTTQTLLAQTTAVSVASSWVFSDLVSPVPLVLGDTYSVIGWENTTGSAWYQYDNAPPAAFNPVGPIQFLNTRFDNGIGPNTFPSQTLVPPGMYGVTDIGYRVQGPGTNVPTPSSLFVLLFGAAGAALRWRRTRPA